MPLRDDVAVKFVLYTLACRELLTRYSELETATYQSPYLPHTTCVAMFDKRLHDFFSLDIGDSKEAAAQRLGGSLQNLADSFRGHVRKAGEIFDQVAAGLQKEADDWYHLDDLERFQIQGRDLARRFYAASPDDTQQRLGRDCSLDVEYNSTGKAAPACYLEKEQTILLRFNFSYTFKDYLAYPFIFLHEFTAHVYARDHRVNHGFQDGWMIFAAEEFLKRERERTWGQGQEFELITTQVKVPDSLKPTSQGDHFCAQVYNLAENFNYHFSDHLMPITFELAAFQPRSGEQTTWPTKFLNSLFAELQSDRLALGTKLQNTRGVRELRDSLITV